MTKKTHLFWIVFMCWIALPVLGFPDRNYQKVNPQKLNAERSSFDGKDVWFEDRFGGVVSSDRFRFDRFGSEMKDYVVFNTAQAGRCLMKRGETDALYKLSQGEEIIVFAKVRMWNPGYGPRYDFFVDKVKRAEKKDSPSQGTKVRIRFHFGEKTMELEEGVEGELVCPGGKDKVKVSFEVVSGK